MKIRLNSRYTWLSMLTLVLIALLQVFPAKADAAVDTLRDIYSTQTGNNTFYMATSADNENSQAITNSTTTFYSTPNAMRLKFTAGFERSIVGIRFIKANLTADTFEITPQMKIAGGLELWVNPKASPRVPNFSVGLVSDSNGQQIETRLPLSKYLKTTDYADKWTRIVIPFRDFSDMGVYFNSTTTLSTPQAFVWNKVRGVNFSADTVASGFYDPSVDNIRFLSSTIKPLSIQGQNIVTDSGDPVRFWGMNLVSVYPTHQQADNLAANLASEGVNAVRLHHLMRNSLDWNTVSKIGALATYTTNSRDPNAEAWDRFDYLNAQMRARGTYIVLSLDASRRYLAGDVDILQTTAQDRTDWMAAMTGLNNMPSNVDLVRMLPMIDERSALLMEEFARRLMTHVNPYTGIAYGNDPQVLYLETMNETSSEYAVVVGNKFESTANPAVAYWKTLLNSKWAAYTASHGVAACDIYSPVTNAQLLARGDFLRTLDLNYFNRMKTLVRGLNSQIPMTFSNLWRGESFQKIHSDNAEVIEDHQYVDPFVVKDFDDVFNLLSRSAPANKPYFIGELNMTGTDAAVAVNAPYRNMLMLATSAYGSFNNWSGIDWFAWSHGDHMLGKDGWSMWEERLPNVASDMIGEIDSDGMALDHLRTTGILFKKGLAAKSTNPITLYVDEPSGTTNYADLIKPKYQFKLGWQDINSIHRAFGAVPAGQPTAPWMTANPTNPLVTDTGEISKNTVRKQLTVNAPQAEAFSGKLDGLPPTGLSHIQVSGSSGSATVIMVSNDGNNFASSQKLIVSRTTLDAANKEIAGAAIVLKQLKASTTTMAWYIKRTRPRVETGYEEVEMTTPGQLTLPADAWHEAELEYAPKGSLPARQSTIQIGNLIRPIMDDSFLISGVLGAAQGGYSVNSGYVIDPNTVFVPAEGTKSLRLKLTAGFNQSLVGINFTNSASKAVQLDYTSLKSKAGLHFWVYTKRKVDSFSIELTSDNNGKLVESRVLLSNYLTAADYGNKWVEVTIPFSAFSDTGVYYDSVTGLNTNMAFLWDKVKGIGFYASTVTSGYYDPYMDDIRVVYTSLP